ncbi:MAG: molybdenum cofactor biosynthesis protein MoaE [Deltaproteobacteria bacterium]|nr:molybdenum cofactor biosynthesis protein MoaE [Deltaproteobacteria bacterium]
MSVVVRFFAVLRERSGADEATVELQPNETVSQLYARLFPDLVDHAGVRLPVMYAVNQAYVEADEALVDGDEVAFIPPLGGGSGDAPEQGDAPEPDPRVRLTHAPLVPADLEAVVSGPGRGGVCTFVGTVRNHFDGRAVQRLEYEAYEEMARAQMSALCDEAEARWPGLGIAMHHRLGTLEIGEAAVIITAASAHRDAAFTACRWGIDTLKDRVPIWKKEVYDDGSTWKANAGSAPDARPTDEGQPPMPDAQPKIIEDSEFGRIPGRLREEFSSDRGRAEVNPYVNRIHELEPWVVPGQKASDFRGAWRTEIGVSEDAPLVLEIGPGNGFFFRDLTGLRPDAGFIGIEIRYKRVWMTGKKALDAGRRNFRVIHQSFGYLDTYFAEAELSEVFINHPDPWPKDRHHKHRLLQPTFGALLASRVAAGGEVQVQSDFAPYGPLALSVFGSEMWERVAFTADLHGGEDTDSALLREGHVPTNYEHKKVGLGVPIMVARFRRTAEPARPPTPEEEEAARQAALPDEADTTP